MMRLRLVHRLSLLLVTLTALCILALAALVAWNLRSGFGQYLAERDKRDLQQLATFIGERLEDSGNSNALADGSLRLRPLLQEFQRNAGLPDEPFDDPRPPPPQGPDELNHRPPPPPRGNLDDRIVLWDLAGHLLGGHPPQRGVMVRQQQPVLYLGKPVALLQMLGSAAPPGGIAARFLRSQYTTLAAFSVGLLALSVVAAYWLSRQMQRPLLAVQQATTRIAAGERDVRIGERAERSDEIGDVIRNINLMSASLQRMDDARRRWVADIAHELRTPLSVLQGEIEALLDGIRPLNQAAMQSLREETERLAGIVGDLHQLSLADLGSLPCQPQWLDGAALLRTVAARFELPAQQRGLQLQVQAPDALQVYWDPRRMEQLLGNLVSNSLRYTDAPGRVLLQLHADSRTLRLYVDDSAPGVPEADRERLFDPLFRGDAARNREQGGSGLGLAICQAIAQAHGGQMAALDSALGGLRIQITFPQTPTKP